MDRRYVREANLFRDNASHTVGLYVPKLLLFEDLDVMYTTALLIGAIHGCRQGSPIRREHNVNRFYSLAADLHNVVGNTALDFRDNGSILNPVNGNLFTTRPRMGPLLRLPIWTDSIHCERAIRSLSDRRAVWGRSD